MDKRKNNGGHSTKGAAGRKPLHQELKGVDLASPYVEESFLTIAKIMKDIKSNSRDRIAAAKLLIEYGCGKPKETIDTNHSFNSEDIKELFKIDTSKS